MQKFTREIVAEVLGATDIIEVIGAVVDLKPAGSQRFKACCPFHAEKTPSFVVSRDRQQYHCFGCNKGGDAISFLSEFEGLTFLEALRKLADRGGIKLPALTEHDGKEDFTRSQLAEFGKFACSFFKNALNDPLKGSACRHYLKGRALAAKTVERFMLGYAPDGWSSLLDKAREAGYKDHILEASGLIRRGEQGRLFDFFRNRLMVPIRDVSGNVVAFGGRDLGDGIPKYINSPENALYKKSRVLYGLNEAREAMRREKQVILVEGYFDALRCFDAGVENVLASCGTALTAEQAGLIRRYVEKVVVVFDADAAGIKAALRGVGLLTNAGLTVKALVLPDGKDPDDFVKAHGTDAFRDLVENSLDFINFYIAMSRDRTATIEGRTTVAREIFTLLSGVNDGLRRDAYLERTAHELQIDKYKCRDEFQKFLNEQAGRAPRKEAEPAKTGAFSQDDCDFLALLVASKPALDKAKQELRSIKQLPAGPLTEVLAVLFDDAGCGCVPLQLGNEEARRLYQAACTQGEIGGEKAADVLEKRIVSLKRQALRVEAARIQEEVDREKDYSRAIELVKRKKNIDAEIDQLGAA